MMNSYQSDHERDPRRRMPRMPPLGRNSRDDVPTIDGLPSDWDPQFIPDPDALEGAALKAMHEVRAFLLMHQDDPDTVVEHLQWLVGLTQAAVTVKGRHRAKAIELGLALRRNYWLKADRMDQFQGFLFILLSAAREVEDPVLVARVYRVWGMCLQARGGQPNAERAIESALEIIRETACDDMALLIRAELFNSRVPHMPEAEALAEGDAILAAAWRVNDHYVIGRVYLGLARMYSELLAYRKAFMYSQQAFAVFTGLNFPELAGEPLLIMIANLQADFCGSDAYRRQILHYFEEHPLCLSNPMISAGFYRNQAVYWYRRDNYEAARTFAVRSYRTARAVTYPPAIAASCHMLGLVQLKRKQWAAARRYLADAVKNYRALEVPNTMITARHALAYIPFEQGDYRAAIGQLREVLVEAREVMDDAAYEQIRENIEGDIRLAQERLDGQ